MAIETTPPQSTEGRKLSPELAKRIISAIILICAALFVAWEGGQLFGAFWALAAIAICWEWLRIADVDTFAPRFCAVVVAAVALGLLSAMPHMSTAWAFLALIPVFAFSSAATFLGRTQRDRYWIASGICYAAVIAFFPPYIREFPETGWSNILWVFAVVWGTDIAAYFVGRSLGGPKLWPRVSPNKTWSGFCGGLAAGTIAGMAVVLFLDNGAGIMSWRQIGIFSAIASVLSQGGDLAESALKRHFGVKDSSFLIPGHGGVMDRLDGFWAAVAFLGICLFASQLVHNWG